MNSNIIQIRKASKADYDQIWDIIKEVIRKGDTYAFSPETSKKEMLSIWCAPNTHTYVAILENKVVGTFMMKNNQPGLGSHVANAGFMVSQKYSGLSIGKKMGSFSIIEAQKLGYKAMQFNMVITSNKTAIMLWEKLGFEIIGEIPDAFKHKDLGYTNVYIMYRKL